MRLERTIPPDGDIGKGRPRAVRRAAGYVVDATWPSSSSVRSGRALQLLMTVVALMLGGCNVINGARSVTITGTPISSTSLSRIQVGETTSQWLIGAFGEPTARTRIERPDKSTAEIWRYRFEERESSSGELLFVYSNWENKVQISTTCFELVNNVVTSYWVEKAP